MREDITLNFNSLQTLGYLSCRVPTDVFNVVNQEVNELLNTNFSNATPYNQYLAGSIEQEYGLYKSVDILNRFFRKVVPVYWQFVNEPNRCDAPLVIKPQPGRKQHSLWVNFQKKYEFNPMHSHSGQLSFVMYVNIPYSLEDERKQLRVANSNSLDNIPCFSFMYPTTALHSQNMNTQDDLYSVSHVGEHKIHIDKHYEGVLLLFPSWLQHAVTPFYTSNDYRISVAGNLFPE
jgi:hypothetical protein